MIIRKVIGDRTFEAIKWDGLQVYGQADWLKEGLKKTPPEVGAVMRLNGDIHCASVIGVTIAAAGDFICWEKELGVFAMTAMEAALNFSQNCPQCRSPDPSIKADGVCAHPFHNQQ